MRARLTYIPTEVAEQFSDFIRQKDEEVLDAVKARARDYSTLSLIKLLYQLRGNSMTSVSYTHLTLPTIYSV